MSTIVRHSRGSYQVEVTDLASVLKAIQEDDFVVTDTNVRDALRLSMPHLAVAPGEASKDMATLGNVLDWLAERANRKSRVVAIGGGVVGDLAGFAAATYMRGIRLCMVPTSLLAMVDSSVGGKVGIDLPHGKNLAGAFWPPEHVHIPIDALSTLPMREFNNGAAEVWKAGVALDAELFERLESAPLGPGDQGLPKTILRCVELKKGVVEEDEHETTGRRAVLNFGHTVGHAIEHALGYKELLHGEAVSIGMIVEARLAHRLGLAPESLAERLQRGLASQSLPTAIPEGLEAGALIEAMKRDKKAKRNALAFSLVSEIGTCRLYEDVDESVVLETLEQK